MVTQGNLGNLGLNLRSPRDFQRGGSGRDISILLVSRCIVGTLRYVGGAYVSIAALASFWRMVQRGLS